MKAATGQRGVLDWVSLWDRRQNTGKWWVSAGCGVVGRVARALGSSKVRILERVLEKKMAEGTPP